MSLLYTKIIKMPFMETGEGDRIVEGQGFSDQGAKVKVAERGKRATQIERPIQKLFPLEMGHGENNDERREAEGGFEETGLVENQETGLKKYPLRNKRD